MEYIRQRVPGHGVLQYDPHEGTACVHRCGSLSMGRASMGGDMASKGMFFEGEQTRQVEMMAGVLRRTLGHGAQMLLAEFTLAAGSEVPMHSHPHDQVGYVVSGSMELTIHDETRACEEGDSYYIPGDVPHKAFVADGAVVIDVFNPPREDYLDS